MAILTFTGELYSKKNTKTTGTEKLFSRRDFAIMIHNEQRPEYPNYIPFQLTQDRCDLINGFKKGELIKVSFDIQGRTWTDQEGVEKIFCNNNAWKIEKVGVQAAAPPPAAPVTPTPAAPTPDSDADDDLPF